MWNSTATHPVYRVDKVLGIIASELQGQRSLIMC